uniref:Uncharacterized protein n=1 Tax=Oryza punctata TaxID=4537 RepID=A0A0E0LBH1_ORYPU
MIITSIRMQPLTLILDIITEAQMASAENANFVVVSNKATMDLISKDVGGYENLGFTPEDMKNILYSKRSLKVDEDELMTNIFWTDSKMIADYEVFSDVVCFDTHIQN